MARVTGIAAALMAALVLGSCGGDDEGSKAASGGGGDKVTVGWSQANNGHPWRTAQTAAVEGTWKDVAAGRGELISTDGQDKPEKQTADVDDLIARGINLLILTPLTADALTPSAKRAMDQDIPVITLDREVNTPVTVHIGADNKAIGKAAANYIGDDLLGGKGTVVELQGTLGASATIDRHDEFDKELKAKYPGVKVIASQTAEYEREAAVKVTEDMLQRFGPGEIDVIYCHNDDMAFGVIQALKSAKRLDEVKVVGIDGADEAFEAIKAGEMAATFTYLNGGKEGVETALKLLEGEQVPSKITLESSTVDASNVDEWLGKGF
jgi:ribose transport system substrate-binding protein